MFSTTSPSGIDTVEPFRYTSTISSVPSSRRIFAKEMITSRTKLGPSTVTSIKPSGASIEIISLFTS